jgi:hypothetical protein
MSKVKGCSWVERQSAQANRGNCQLLTRDHRCQLSGQCIARRRCAGSRTCRRTTRRLVAARGGWLRCTSCPPICGPVRQARGGGSQAGDPASAALGPKDTACMGPILHEQLWQARESRPGGSQLNSRIILIIAIFFFLLLCV